VVVAGFLEEAREIGELAGGEVGELLAVEVEDGLVEVVDELSAGGGEGESDDAAVVGAAVAFEQAAVDEAVGQTGDVGGFADELVGDVKAGQAVGGGVPEDAQDVVGGLGEVVLLEELGEVVGEEACGADEVEVGLLLGEVEGVLLADVAGEPGGGM